MLILIIVMAMASSYKNNKSLLFNFFFKLKNILFKKLFNFLNFKFLLLLLYFYLKIISRGFREILSIWNILKFFKIRSAENTYKIMQNLCKFFSEIFKIFQF